MDFGILGKVQGANTYFTNTYMLFTECLWSKYFTNIYYLQSAYEITFYFGGVYLD